MNQTQLEEFKNILLGDKKRIESEIENLKDTDYGDDVDSFDEESDETEQMAANFPISGHLKDRLRGINKALKNIEDGTYGKCSNCQKEISPERLKAKPEATTCITCGANE